MNIFNIFISIFGGMLNPEVLKCHEDFITLETHVQQGNSVAQDLPPTGSEANTTICFFYIYIGYRFPLSLSTIVFL